MAPKRTRSAAKEVAASPKRRAAKLAVPDGVESPDHRKQESPESTPKPKSTKDDGAHAEKKFKAWSDYQNDSPFPDFKRPTAEECKTAHKDLSALHQEAVDAEFNDPDTPETIPHVLDAMIVAILSQATGWNNAKRAMNSMKETYGSVFAYDKIMSGGRDKLQETIKCGGLHVRKSMIITTVLGQVKERHGKWDLDHLFNETDEEAMKELMTYKYMGPKSASVVMNWCLKRDSFTVDVHIYRIAGLWGWRPERASKESAQSHLNARIPTELQFDLHFLLLQHGRECPACKGGAKQGAICLLKGKNTGKA